MWWGEESTIDPWLRSSGFLSALIGPEADLLEITPRWVSFSPAIDRSLPGRLLVQIEEVDYF